MNFTTMTSRKFSQDARGAQRTAELGPVFITDRGRTAHVLLTAEAYQTLADQQTKLVDLLGMPKGANIAFDPPRSRISHRPFDFD